MQTPNHVAIIMDGNGRWAKKRGLPRSLGHKAGVEALRGIITHCADLPLTHLTVYGFSTENFKRPAEEVGALMGLLIEYFKKDIRALKKNGVRIRIIGDTSPFPQEVQKVIVSAQEETREGRRLQFTIALGYGGRQEILQAVNGLLAEKKEGVTEEEFAARLYTGGLPDPDFIIRTSGEERLSNFLLYQAAYAELYFCNTLWPDFTVADFDNALEVYAGRARRFGGV